MADRCSEQLEAEPCVICLDPIEDPATLPCLHVFCFECIVTAVRSFSLSSCAVCRSPFSSLRHSGVEKTVVFPADPSRGGREEGAESRTALRRRTRRLRRNVYLRKLYARPLVQELGDEQLRWKDTSPEFYRQNPAALHPLIPFMHRDLRLFLPGTLANQLEQTLIDMFKSHAITSEQVRVYLDTYLGKFASHFLHEVKNYAQSIYELKKYDRLVQHRRRMVVMETRTVVDTDDVIHREEGELT